MRPLAPVSGCMTGILSSARGGFPRPLMSVAKRSGRGAKLLETARSPYPWMLLLGVQICCMHLNESTRTEAVAICVTNLLHYEVNGGRRPMHSQFQPLAILYRSFSVRLPLASLVHLLASLAHHRHALASLDEALERIVFLLLG